MFNHNLPQLQLRAKPVSLQKRVLFLPLVTHLPVLFTHEVAFAVSLEHGNDLGEPLISHVFQFSQHTGSEENLMNKNTYIILSNQA